MLRIILSACLAGTSAACSSTNPQSQKNIAVGLLEPQLVTIEAGVRSVMKDPESARFGPYWAAQKPDGTTIVCGYVNGRNSFGGYTGDKPYLAGLAADNAFGGATIASDESSVFAVRKVCAGTIPGYGG